MTVIISNWNTTMKNLIRLFSLSAVLLLAVSCENKSASFLAEYPQIDLLISNGKILDGLGNETMNVDLVVVGDEIVFVGKTAFTAADLKQRVKHLIDAKQQVVAPGFIDLHSHGDPLATPAFENFLAMGVTTITLGQDGDSPKVLKLGDWLDKVESKGIALNLAMFVGHGTLRELTGINQNPDPDKESLSNMLAVLDETLEYSFGMSTGLEYHPGLYAKEAELTALAKVIGKHNRLIMSHVRNEDNDQLATSIEELLTQGKYAKVHLSHIKSVYGHGADEAEQILQILTDARNNGIKISADIYPYNASFAGISLLFPLWAKTIEQFDVAMVERKTELETFLRNKITKRNGSEATLLGTSPYTGKTLADLSSELGIPFEQVLIKLGPKGASGAYFIMDDELQTRLLIDSQISISSDGSPEGFHPRGHGTFAKIIEVYVNQRKLLTLPEAVRKMTSQSAKILGISDRGILQAGMKADIIIFNPAKVKAMATYSEPHQLAQGFETIIVNGKIAKANGNMAESFYGKVLKPE